MGEGEGGKGQGGKDKGGMGGGMDNKVVCVEESMACEESLGIDFSQMDMGEGEGGKGQGGKNQGGKNQDEHDGMWNSFYFCLIQQAHTMNDPDCGAMLTTDEETKKGGKIGRNCLDEANLCSLQAV